MSIYSHKLLLLRKKSGLTPEAVAKIAGISRQTVVRVETGEARNPTIATLAAIAKVFGKNIVDLMGKNP